MGGHVAGGSVEARCNVLTDCMFCDTCRYFHEHLLPTPLLYLVRNGIKSYGRKAKATGRTQFAFPVFKSCLKIENINYIYARTLSSKLHARAYLQ